MSAKVGVGQTREQKARVNVVIVIVAAFHSHHLFYQRLKDVSGFHISYLGGVFM